MTIHPQVVQKNRKNSTQMQMDFTPLTRLVKSHPAVELAYVFGSTVTGRGWKKVPDVDIAVLVNADRVTLGEEIRETLEKELKRHVDVVLLNYTPPLMRFEVIKNGRILFYRDVARKVDFEVKSLLEFYDMEPLREWAVAHTRHLIRAGKI